MDDKYIVIPKWSKFQHYKDRDPKWIKNYTRLLSDDDYLGLTASRRALLHGLWMVYAQTVTSEGLAEDLPRTCLRLDVEMLNRRLGLAAKMADYESLNHAGFIHILASNTLAERYQPASNLLAQKESKTTKTEKGSTVSDTPKPQTQTPNYDVRAKIDTSLNTNGHDDNLDDLFGPILTTATPSGERVGGPSQKGKP